ncbi:Alpha/Beta hydrolase protein [Podospora australis]|uniref:Alpha/Beta hydrolase protein n=1 Tax=Podospora australis TaxID=1536484 RepID=A0AAN6WQ75_9PEZI|nr:Alpha/Beta hydrolase protein [Podospora australis]
MARLTLDADYAKIIAPYTSFVPPVATDAASLRRINDTLIQGTMSLYPGSNGDVTETKLSYTSADGNTITLHRFTPSTSSNGNNNPAIIYVHGGGFVSGSVAGFRKDIVRYASETGHSIFAPAYRLAPEFAFPKPVEDVYAALEFLRDNAAEVKIDPKRIALMGVSAGGGIAAGVALMARDKNFEPAIRKLVLIYPMLDDRTRIGEDHPMYKHLTWTMTNNVIGWEAYLAGAGAGVVGGGDKVSPYAAPARASDVSRLPKTYIDVGGLDLFKDEVLAFGGRLLAASVDVEFHLYPGVPHAWEWIAHSASVTKKAVQNRVWALQDL